MYNPSDVGVKGSLFGLPYTEETADIIILPVNLDATASYGDGTAQAPDFVLSESTQLDLSLINVKEPWKLKVAMEGRLVSKDKNAIHRGRARNVIKALEAGKSPDQKEIGFVNEFCESVHNLIETESASWLEQGKIVGIIGGDHSSPLGLIRALAATESFGILQIDAHMDLRKDYQGFNYSHASIMYNALQVEGTKSLTQVGVRDFCEEESTYIRQSEKDIHVFFDEALFQEKMEGKSWSKVCEEIISTLPDKVYVSFDVDGLDPSLCPNTGTPVPGGLSFYEASFLIEEVVKAGKKIVGFDISETGGSSWDANVGARSLYRLAVQTGISNGLLSLT